MQERRVVNDTGLVGFFNRVYSVMGSGLLLTAAISYLLGTVFYNQYANFVANHTFMFYILLFLPLFLSMGVNSRRAQANAGYAGLMFYLISACYGTTFTVILIQYQSSIVAISFLTTAVIFLTMSVVGRITKQDLSRAGVIATSALIGVILLSVINFFMQSSGLQLILSYAILVIFIVLTAFDTQKLKTIYMSANQEGGYVVNTNTLAIQGALALYLDFLNIFLVVLRLFGGSSSRD
ncbi:MAG: Bax inhibitor-1/YccA family protein [Lactobacillus sp.]|jgi:FtsH-binding integral membrane protein|uniref:Bax inhibitor-1/YccA family protein n=1 Tax=Lacticaseibacillus suilingensis TaxID=2799577 RepID=A0ABW4BHQ8_9LACO|nr:Bax inhibitor-1/YccA family protein [Lacticaseibacillus suilingensis]MCI1894865.1 Bax inhibitor-1/YccA family protein [Lactobacillus sp.]MCI1917471.1 Bax inhibitor-1/YccA family protein [Lactobacillus sp.]MCI1940626.1 Bax inhibitor-1/YccA family protein [Lactobacillus sp.]MCI1971312.1 Bax inhibitor-1/YccA family protein [Lactobacillus sp.]MCI2017787.1 Bax inhibitor-1/YccA family protein [Lactobacillus sp.]